MSKSISTLIAPFLLLLDFRILVYSPLLAANITSRKCILRSMVSRDRRCCTVHIRVKNIKPDYLLSQRNTYIEEEISKSATQRLYLLAIELQSASVD